jgi:hypothetical protein
MTDLPLHSFNIQHSDDDITFSSIGTVQAINGTSSYSFVDTHPGTGNNIYRLQLIADDGSITYSRIVQLNGAAITDQAGLVPTVSENGASSLVVSFDHGTSLMYTMADISGHILLHNSIQLAGGQHTLPLDLSHLSAGVYFVHVTGGDGFNKTLTLIKK